MLLLVAKVLILFYIFKILSEIPFEKFYFSEKYRNFAS